MKVVELIELIRADGAELVLLPSGRLRITGTHAERWIPILGQYERELLDALRAPASTDTAAEAVLENPLLTGRLAKCAKAEVSC